MGTMNDLAAVISNYHTQSLHKTSKEKLQYHDRYHVTLYIMYTCTDSFTK